MNSRSVRSTLTFAIIGTIAWCGVLIYWDGVAWRETLLMSPLLFGLFFFTMLASNRISVAIARRQAVRTAAKQPPRGPSTVAPTSERVEHNLRRRERQRTERPRGNDRRRR